MQGIPTTRAGSVVTSDSRVTRDMFYSGNPQQERCSVVMRVAPTFLRFGSFEIFKPTDSTTGEAIRTLRKALHCYMHCVLVIKSSWYQTVAGGGHEQVQICACCTYWCIHCAECRAFTKECTTHRMYSPLSCEGPDELASFPY